MKRILVISEGPGEIGRGWNKILSNKELPALPVLVRRIIGTDDYVFVCRDWHRIPHAGGGIAGNIHRKVKRAIQLGQIHDFDAVVIVIDRDGSSNRNRIKELTDGRAEFEHHPAYPVCAVGLAIEYFDAWMICDENAIEQAGGDKSKCHTTPESLAGKEGSGKHPKDRAAQIFGSGKGLSSHYKSIAEHIDIDRLTERCPDGFAPFRKDVETRIIPLFK